MRAPSGVLAVSNEFFFATAGHVVNPEIWGVASTASRERVYGRVSASYFVAGNFGSNLTEPVVTNGSFFPVVGDLQNVVFGN